MLANALIRAASQQSGYRYWSLLIAENVGGYAFPTYLALPEVELRGAPGGGDLTTPSTPVTCTGSALSGHPVSAMVDNNLSTSYINPVNSPRDVRVVFDLGSPKEVAAVAIYRDAFTPNEQMPKTFTLDASRDGVTFETKGSFTNIDWPDNTWKQFIL
ncbi:discoidin domain-containing protein [Ottowia sp. GY511]|uniref:Discoidin domain-containing protein n=1 Tax=Ottowia flava TaxID=2675430 RepID=A0ABW4KM77_9BURK|nr:discoidin domain-containing protein [Ottowia sp. GY511]TXK26364.1 discoidin domain-containing protein [Ottowia sp. GY511]